MARFRTTQLAKIASTAERLARGLTGLKAGGGWMGHCPAHEDRKPSLSIREANDGKVLVYCHAGCAQDSVISALRQRGLWADDCPRTSSSSTARALATQDPDLEHLNRSKAALKIWQFAKPTEETTVEYYFRSRGLYLPMTPAIRFSPRLKHPCGGFWPAMVALVTRGAGDEPLAIHRTFLAPDGSGKAQVDPQKMMLGPCRGGAVKLAPAGEVLMVGEGIETCLAAMQATGMPAWAALSTSGLRALDLPDVVWDLIVLADGDDAGEAAAQDAALRWKRERRRVRIARPPRGFDFNDLLLGCAPITEEGVQ